MGTEPLARGLLALGTVALLGGLLLLGARRLGIDRIPGDIRFHLGDAAVYLPLGTCLLVSVVATIVLSLVSR